MDLNVLVLAATTHPCSKTPSLMVVCEGCLIQHTVDIR